VKGNLLEWSLIHSTCTSACPFAWFFARHGSPGRGRGYIAHFFVPDGERPHE